MITELPIKGFQTTLHNSVNNYPQSTNKNLPKLFMNALFVASRGGSKTHTCVRLIKEYETTKLIDNDNIVHPLRVFLISPTVSANKIFDNLQSLHPDDIYEEYTEELFQSIIDDIDKTEEEVKQYKLYCDTYNLIMKTKSSKIIELLKRQPNIIDILETFDYQHPDEIDIRFKERPVNFIVLDDLMSSSAFSRKAESLLTYYLIRNRHKFISFFILVQHIRALAPAIRNNCNWFFIGKFCSYKYITDTLYEEVSNVLSEKEFIDLYLHSTAEKYGGLVIDNTGEEKRFYKSLDKELIIK